MAAGLPPFSGLEAACASRFHSQQAVCLWTGHFPPAGCALPSGTASVPVIPAPGVLSVSVNACRSSLLGDRGWGVLPGAGPGKPGCHDSTVTPPRELRNCHRQARCMPLSLWRLLGPFVCSCTSCPLPGGALPSLAPASPSQVPAAPQQGLYKACTFT